MIREFKANDLNSVNNLLTIFDYKLTLESFNNKFLNVLVYEEEIIKGVLIFQFLFDRIEIEYIITDLKYRKCGIGTKLLNYLQNKYKGIKNITLEVRESNDTAINFYIENGFSVITKRKNYYKDEDGILMIKNLGE